MAAVRSKFEMHDVHACRAFVRGRCLKTVLDDDPKCREGHDRPKSEVICCSMHKPGDLLYNKGFTQCRSLVGFPPSCGNEASTAMERPGTRFRQGTLQGGGARG